MLRRIVITTVFTAGLLQGGYHSARGGSEADFYNPAIAKLVTVERYPDQGAVVL